MNKKICFKTLDGYLFINPDDIDFVKAEDVYAYVYIDKSKHYINCSLKSLEERLSNLNFIRCHRSYLVNIDKVIKLIKATNFSLLLENGMEVPIARNKKGAIIIRLGITK